MLDLDTFLTQLYVMVDEFCQSHLPPERGPGPAASLTRSEVITLALVSQWYRFRGERDFYHWAASHLRSAFPRLPSRPQFNRLVRRHQGSLEGFFTHLVELLERPPAPREALDSTGVPVRHAARRGHGHLVGQANRGWCRRLGWYEGFHLLLSITPRGVVTGFGFGPATSSDVALAETFLAARQQRLPHLGTVGQPAAGPYLTDNGFSGVENHQRWRLCYGAQVFSPPRRDGPVRKSPRSWPEGLRRRFAGLRQIVETAIANLQGFFRLNQDRPHLLAGFRSRLTAKMALYNFCIWLNVTLGRSPLAFAELMIW